MQKREISVTEAARNFADCVNRAHYQNTSFVLLKNGVPMAELVPPAQKTCTGAQLAEVLSRLELSPEEKKTWSRDLAVARKTLRRAVNRWR